MADYQLGKCAQETEPQKKDGCWLQARSHLFCAVVFLLSTSLPFPIWQANTHDDLAIHYKKWPIVNRGETRHKLMVLHTERLIFIFWPCFLVHGAGCRTMLTWGVQYHSSRRFQTFFLKLCAIKYVFSDHEPGSRAGNIQWQNIQLTRKSRSHLKSTRELDLELE